MNDKLKDKLLRIYSGDYSAIAYNLGVDDRIHDKSRNKYRWMKAIHPVNYIYNFDTSFESFQNNYGRGYNDGDRVVNNIYNMNKSINKGENNMDIKSYEDAISVSKLLIHHLGTTRIEIEKAKNNYQDSINQAQAKNFMNNYISEIIIDKNIFNSQCDALELICVGFIDHINRDIKILEEQAANATKKGE